MAIGLPITPVQASGTAGKTVKVVANNTPTSVTGTLDCTTKNASAILVTNGGTNAAGGDPGTGCLVFVRVSAEPSTTIAAAATDIPLNVGRSIILMNPVPAGKTGLAVLSSGTTANDVFFTPIEGGF